MAHDEEFADRVRQRLSEEDGMTEKRTLGGIAFLALPAKD
jgi:hypothetical protein